MKNDLYPLNFPSLPPSLPPSPSPSSLLLPDVEEVCFNDSLVSGDPVLALLLDPSVVLLWARGMLASTLGMLHLLCESLCCVRV